MNTNKGSYGYLAQQAGSKLRIQVLKSHAGFYIGTCDDDGPFTRESLEYWPSRDQAIAALEAGDWTQKPCL